MSPSRFQSFKTQQPCLRRNSYSYQNLMSSKETQCPRTRKCPQPFQSFKTQQPTLRRNTYRYRNVMSSKETQCHRKRKCHLTGFNHLKPSNLYGRITQSCHRQEVGPKRICDRFVSSSNEDSWDLSYGNQLCFIFLFYDTK